MGANMRLVVRSVIVAIALVSVQRAAAVGPWLWTVQGGPGITSPSGDVRYVARLAGSSTKVIVIRRSDGRVLHTRSVPGDWGLQAATLQGGLTGLSGDGRLLALTPPTRGQPLTVSTFVLLRAPALASVRTIRLRGDFTIDALSPRGRTLYLIQHLVGSDGSRYQVRAYDVRASKLLPRVVVDKRQAGWTMRGYPVARAATRDASRVYTLYRNDNNYPFVHALDTVHMTAVCVGLPLNWANPTTLDNVRLTLSDNGRTLTVKGPHLGKPVTIDTRTYKITPHG
jgi:hypothetical protein